MLPGTLGGLAGRAHPRGYLRATQMPGRAQKFRVRADDAKATLERNVWADQGFPSYMQSRVDNLEFCRTWAEEIALAEKRQSQAAAEMSELSEASDGGRSVAVWQAIRREALREAAQEPMLSSFLYASILAHDSFERALAFVLSNRLANATMLPTQLFEIFHEVLAGDEQVRQGALADVEACRERDPSCGSYSQALLFYKGFHAIQTHRIAHSLWHRGQRVMAIMLQSRVSEVFAVDIHPAARIGCGVLLDHGTGVVIGETAVIGNNCSLLQNVTLGGTGKEVGDRHPKIRDNVLIGASATILGNIVIGKGSQIAAGSLVLKPVEPRTMVAGSPASPVGTVSGNPALQMQHWLSKFKDGDDLCGVALPPAGGGAAQEGAADAAPVPAAEAARAPAAASSAGAVASEAAEVAVAGSSAAAAEVEAADAAAAVGAAADAVAEAVAVPSAVEAEPPASTGVAEGAQQAERTVEEAVGAQAALSEEAEQAAAPSSSSPRTSAVSPQESSPGRLDARPTAASHPAASAPSEDTTSLQNGNSSHGSRAKGTPSKPSLPIKAPSYAADSSGWSMTLFDEPDYMI